MTSFLWVRFLIACTKHLPNAPRRVNVRKPRVAKSCQPWAACRPSRPIRAFTYHSRHKKMLWAVYLSCMVWIRWYGLVAGLGARRWHNKMDWYVNMFKSSRFSRCTLKLDECNWKNISIVVLFYENLSWFIISHVTVLEFAEFPSPSYVLFKTHKRPYGQASRLDCRSVFSMLDKMHEISIRFFHTVYWQDW